MNKKDLISYCLTMPLTYEDYPFDDMADDGAWAVMRHKTNKKGFAFIYERNGKLCINLKCDPFEADIFRQIYKDLIPAYHMNKQHWNTIILNGDVPENELLRMIGNSYDLIKPKTKRLK